MIQGLLWLKTVFTECLVNSCTTFCVNARQHIRVSLGWFHLGTSLLPNSCNRIDLVCLHKPVRSEARRKCATKKWLNLCFAWRGEDWEEVCRQSLQTWKATARELGIISSISSGYERSSGLQSLPGRIELGVKERLCNGNDGETAACRSCQISIAEHPEEQIRSSFGRNDIL